MRKETVVSSIVAWVQYAASTQVLVVGFVRGTVYEFFNVPAEEHLALMSAPSKGRQFNSFIRGRFPHRRVTSSSWN
jgi:hypothetical protein